MQIVPDSWRLRIHSGGRRPPYAPAGMIVNVWLTTIGEIRPKRGAGADLVAAPGRDLSVVDREEKLSATDAFSWCHMPGIHSRLPILLPTTTQDHPTLSSEDMRRFETRQLKVDSLKHPVLGYIFAWARHDICLRRSWYVDMGAASAQNTTELLTLPLIPYLSAFIGFAPIWPFQGFLLTLRLDPASSTALHSFQPIIPQPPLPYLPLPPTPLQHQRPYPPFLFRHSHHLLQLGHEDPPTIIIILF